MVKATLKEVFNFSALVSIGDDHSPFIFSNATSHLGNEFTTVMGTCFSEHPVCLFGPRVPRKDTALCSEVLEDSGRASALKKRVCPHIPGSHCYNKGFCEKNTVAHNDKTIRAQAALQNRPGMLFEMGSHFLTKSKANGVKKMSH